MAIAKQIVGDGPNLPVSPTNGGTGVSNPTAHGILIAEGSSPMVTKVLTNGQILVGSTGNDPVATSIASGTGISVSNGAGSISVALSTPVSATNGGTGVSNPTTNGILVAKGSSAAVTKVLTNGQVLIGSTGAEPVGATLTSGTGITITNASGSITIAGGSNNIVTESTTARTFVLSDANCYIRTTNASATTLTVPLNSSVAFPIGTQIDVFQAGAGAVTFAATGGVTINTVALAISKQYKGATLIKVATDTWDLITG